MLLPALVLLGCAGHAPAPIEERGARGSSAGPRSYRVVRGDTMYSIAFRFGLDFRRLAAANAIAEPYTIYPGQELRLAEVESLPRRSGASAPVKKPAPQKAPAAAPSSGGPHSGVEYAQAAAAGTGSSDSRAPAECGGQRAAASRLELAR
jgi:lipoprotein NlpD